MAAVGVSHWDFHGGPGDWYAAITYPSPFALDAPPTVHPLFYGIWLFSDTVANSSALMSLQADSSNSHIVSWATLSESTNASIWKIVVVHKDLAAVVNATVTISLPNPVSPSLRGSLRVLSCSGGPYATNGVHFGGQTFDGTPDGTIQGTPVVSPVEQDEQGRFTFSLAPLTAAQLTVTIYH